MEGYGCTFVSWELDEMYIESEYLVYQIGIEDGAVFAVVLRIVETFLEVEILLAVESDEEPSLGLAPELLSLFL